MATTLPQKLRIPSIQPFATRAAQLEKFRPIISYWCEYHIVNQILARGLHSEDDECKLYTLGLMDKLEKSKNQTPPVDAIVDDFAAKAYIEQFALETFQKADDAIHTDKASRQTIDTFQAASTFFELLNDLGTPDPEITSKVKYAKYHALRIAKAIKAGEDPNASNPKDDLPTGAPGEDLAVNGLESPPMAGGYQPPSVEAVPDAALPLTSPPMPPNIPSVISPPTAPPVKPEPDVSPIEPANVAPQPQASSSDEYFPPVPTLASRDRQPSASTVPPAASQFTNDPLISADTPTAPPLSGMQSPQDFYNQSLSHQPPPVQSTAPHFTSPPPPPAPIPAPVQPILPPAQPQHIPPQPITAQSQPPAPPTAYRTDDQSISQAQKHAKWAMSALNFDDVPTAVKELRLALELLGAS